MDRGNLRNQAGRLLKNREMAEAIRVITIAKPSAQPEVSGQKPKSRWSWGDANGKPAASEEKRHPTVQSSHQRAEVGPLSALSFPLSPVEGRSSVVHPRQGPVRHNGQPTAEDGQRTTQPADWAIRRWAAPALGRPWRGSAARLQKKAGKCQKTKRLQKCDPLSRIWTPFRQGACLINEQQTNADPLRSAQRRRFFEKANPISC